MYHQASTLSKPAQNAEKLHSESPAI